MFFAGPPRCVELIVADHPIIFSGPMVRAMLAGRKTQTRRLATSPLRGTKPGDRLWVREQWKSTPAYDDLKPSEMGGEEPIHFVADGTVSNWPTACGVETGRRRPGMHMPRWASRITLIAEAVRIEPLQAISETDAMAEGAAQLACDDEGHFWESASGSYRCGYAGLWDRLHWEGSWDSNPDVVVVDFRLVHHNIDQLQAG